MKLINSALDKYASLASTPGKGLPRGLGISAYLAELYMREFDSEIRNGAEVVYYSRYVDDIVVLFAPTKSSDVGSYFGWIQSCVSKHKLQINPAAGKTSTFIKDDGAWSFEYLGYKYEGPSNSLKIKLSDKKFSRYQARVKKCFQEYHATRHKSLKGAHRLLVQRMRFLTGNTRLLHSKKNAFVGIFYSNPHLTNLAQLTALDNLKAQLTHKPYISLSLRTKLKSITFKEGYERRRFAYFGRDHDLQLIVDGWKHAQ